MTLRSDFFRALREYISTLEMDPSRDPELLAGTAQLLTTLGVPHDVEELSALQELKISLQRMRA